MRSDQGGVNWQDEAPPPAVPCFDVLSPRYDQRLRCICLSQRQTGAWMHYVAPRTQPCTRGSGGCEGCRQGLRRYWKGFLYGWFDRARPVAILEYTAAAAERYQRRLCGLGAPIAGCQVVAWRRDGRVAGQVVIEIADAPHPGAPTMQLPDLRWALLRMWNAPTRGSDAPPRPPAPGEDGELIPFPGVG